MSGWINKPLGDLCQLISGQHIDSKDYNVEERGIGYLTGPSDFGELYPLVTKWTQHPKVTALRGDILVTVKGSGVGKINVLDDQHVAISRQLMAIRVTGADPRFVCTVLLSMLDQMRSLATGAAIPGISREQILSLEIPLPPLSEQQRIAGILDEAFEGIATAKANTERNVANARALFDSHLDAVFTHRGQGWVERSLISLCTEFVDSAHRTPKYQPEGIPALRPRDVVNGSLNLAAAARVSSAEFEIQSKRYKPRPGDIVYSRELSYGWAALLPDEPRVCLSQGMCVFRLTADLDANLLLYMLNSSIGRHQAVTAAVGAAHPHINLGDIKAFQLPVPPIEEQSAILQMVDAFADGVTQLDSVYRQKLNALDDLKKSLLHQAFTGQL